MMDLKVTEGNVKIQVGATTLDRSNVDELKSKGEASIENSDGSVAVDLSGVGFIDSSGVGGLLFLNNKLPEARRPVRLTGVAPEVLGVLELTRVHRVFDIEAVG